MTIKHYIAGGTVYEAFAAFADDRRQYIEQPGPGRGPRRELIWQALELRADSIDVHEPIEWTLDHSNRVALLSTSISLNVRIATEILGSELEAATITVERANSKANQAKGR